MIFCTERTKQDHKKFFLLYIFFYTQQGKTVETPADRENTMSRFWRHVAPNQSGNQWIAELPVSTVDKPLWVYANVRYALAEPVIGAGYYYGTYTANAFIVSSLMEKISPEQLKSAGVVTTIKPSLTIETFNGDWQKEWFTYKPGLWARSTYKLNDHQWKASSTSNLALEIYAAERNQLVILLDNHAAEITLDQPEQWQTIELKLSDFRNFENAPLTDWKNVRLLKLSNAERLRSSKRGSRESRIKGKNWNGADPEFRNLRWKN